MSWRPAWRRTLAVAALCLLGAARSEAGLQACSDPPELSARQQDVLFRFGGIVRQHLEASGGGVALIARSGTDLSRFGIRYSHAGISVRDHADTPWAVRQLYFACDEKRPRIYDQGIAGFLLGTDLPDLEYVSVVVLPAQAAAPVVAAARDNALALQLLGRDYSANAHAWSTRYQNCNQWVVELLAAAWGGLARDGDMRGRAQDWLRAAGYQPTEVNVALWGGASIFVPWLSTFDHPRSDWDRLVNRISLPTSLEAFVRARVPGARRIEFCHRGPTVVIHEGWDDLRDGCRAGAGDTELTLGD